MFLIHNKAFCGGTFFKGTTGQHDSVVRQIFEVGNTKGPPRGRRPGTPTIIHTEEFCGETFFKGTRGRHDIYCGVRNFQVGDAKMPAEGWAAENKKKELGCWERLIY